jgi:hypothetical protein
MAMDLLQQFLGGDRQRQDDYDDFVRRFQNDPHSISDEEAAHRYREMMRNAPPDALEEANEYAFGQLDPQDRRQVAERFRQRHDDPSSPFQGFQYRDDDEAADPRNLGRMMRQAEDQDPSFLEQILGGGRGRAMGQGGGQDQLGSLLNSPMGKAAMAAGAAYLANRFLSQQGRGVQGGLGSIRKGRNSGLF